MSKIDLTNFTFIIPAKIESESRKRNAKIVLNFLDTHLDTNIMIYEAGSKIIPSLIDIDRDNFHYFHEDILEGEPFHRTKYLNFMLKRINTKYTVNYDIDVILPLETFVNASSTIEAHNIDILYPYGNSSYSQKKVNQLPLDSYFKKDSEFYKDLNLFFEIMESGVHAAAYAGHCQIIKTVCYIKAGMEDENFISWGPEDRERISRFARLGYKVGHLARHTVYHLEHARGGDSAESNKWFANNEKLFHKIDVMSMYEYLEYIENSKKNLGVDLNIREGIINRLLEPTDIKDSNHSLETLITQKSVP